MDFPHTPILGAFEGNRLNEASEETSLHYRRKRQTFIIGRFRFSSPRQACTHLTDKAMIRTVDPVQRAVFLPVEDRAYLGSPVVPQG